MPIDSKECFAALTEDGQLWEIYQAAQTGGGGITSINGDTTAAQTIAGTAPIGVASVGGTTTISSTQAGTATNGYLSSTDWNTFNNKVNRSGDTMTGKLNLPASTTVSAGINIGSGVAPTSPVSGDLWVDATTLNVRVGATNRPLAFTNGINTFSRAQVIDASEPTTPALRVTQRGTGEALRVEDDTTPDTTAFVVSNSGRVGIGVTPDATVALSVDTTGIKFGDNTVQTTAAVSGVTSVTATAPLTSSGGATPNISTSIATNRIVGRSTAGTGVMEQLTPVGITVSGGNITGIGGTVGTVDNAVPRADGTGGYTVQGSDIVIDDATTTTQNNVAITNQHAGQTNSALVLTPKGTGALIAGPKPDGTTTGGNARGANAVDLQTSRAAATQVASGANAVIAGGQSNAASGTYSAIVGGQNNTATQFGTFVGGGFLNTSSGQVLNRFPSVVCGGDSNTASAFSTFVGGGRSNTANNGYSCVVGGYNNLASGDTSVVVGGGQKQGDSTRGNVASGVLSSILGGAEALADRWGMQAHANGSFLIGTGRGDAQRARFVMRNKTTTNAAVELFLDGSSTRLTIPSGKYLTGTINIAGIKSDGTAAARYIRQFSIKNVAATTSLVGTVDTIGVDQAASTSISITADDTNDSLKVEVTGIASETWRWVAAVDVVEVAYGT